jgi:hypothetical protein
MGFEKFRPKLGIRVGKHFLTKIHFIFKSVQKLIHTGPSVADPRYDIVPLVSEKWLRKTVDL